MAWRHAMARRAALPTPLIDFDPATFGFADASLYGYLTNQPANTGSLVGLYTAASATQQPTFRASGGPNDAPYSDGIAADAVSATWGNAPTQFLHDGSAFTFACVAKKLATNLNATRYAHAVTRSSTGLARGLVLMNDGTASLRRRWIVGPNPAPLDISFGTAVRDVWESEVLVYDDAADEFRCYVNGVLEATVTRANAFQAGTSQNDFRIHFGNETQVARVMAWDSVVDVDAVHALISSAYGIGP